MSRRDRYHYIAGDERNPQKNWDLPKSERVPPECWTVIPEGEPWPWQGEGTPRRDRLAAFIAQREAKLLGRRKRAERRSARLFEEGELCRR